jgi:hypothetical protein
MKLFINHDNTFFYKLGANGQSQKELLKTAKQLLGSNESREILHMFKYFLKHLAHSFTDSKGY